MQEQIETPQQRRARLGYWGCVAEDMNAYVGNVADTFGFTPDAIIENSPFSSWEACREKWGYTGDPQGYFKEAISQSAHNLKYKRNAADNQRKREENARKHGGEICTRCGGYGGHTSWPGWVCFDCGGRGFTVSL